MGLRWKVALALAALALIATTAVGVIGYRSTEARLVDEVDQSITQSLALVVGRPGTDRVPTRGLLEVYSVRVINRRGVVSNSSFEADVPVADDTESVLGAPGSTTEYTVTVDGERASLPQASSGFASDRPRTVVRRRFPSSSGPASRAGRPRA